MNATSAIALSGMNAAQAGLQVAAHNIANLSTVGFRRGQVVQSASDPGGVTTSVSQARQPGASLPEDMVGLLQSRNSFLANLAVFRSGERMLGSLLDAVG